MFSSFAPPGSVSEPVIDCIHGISVSDPYRWLEDPRSPRTRSWIEQQGAYARDYFSSIPSLHTIRERVSELMADSTPADLWRKGDQYFFLRRQPGAEQPSILTREGLRGRERVLVDPAARGNGNGTAVGIVALSEDARFLAYSIRNAGTDHSATEILDLASGAVIPDSLPQGFCTGLVFRVDGTGFYYSHRRLDDPRTNYRAAMFHRFGSSRSEDEEVFFAGDEPNLFLRLDYSPFANTLAYVLFRAGKHRRTSLYVQHLEAAPLAPKLLLKEIEGVFVPFFMGSQLLAYTDIGAENFRIVKIGMENPEPGQWQEIVPETDRRIQQFAALDDKLFVTRVDRFSTKVECFRANGDPDGELALPCHGTIDLLRRGSSGESLLLSYTSILQPPTIHHHDLKERRISVWEKAAFECDSSTVVTEEVEYTSKDGTSVPLFLAYRNDLQASGPLPAFLTGYGGFGSCVTPRFSAFETFLLERGVLLAIPALRGGSELGEQWHKAGCGQKRHNTFADFIAAAEWLLSSGRAERRRIAIGGGSNAGLLVGVAITERPDLFRAAVCLGPLLDMVRFHLFDFASVWAEEYGTPDDEQDFRALIAYSPYHQIKKGAHYPAVLFISGDADTRCNPMHVRKMAARLQSANTSTNPILLDYRPAWGHTAVQPLSTKIEALSKRLAFVCHELGIDVETRR